MSRYMFVAYNEAGEPRAWAYDDGDEIENAEILAEWKAMGRTVSRVPADEALALMEGSKAA